MLQTAYITLETDHDGFTFVKNHEELPTWLVDYIESHISGVHKPFKGKTKTIGRVTYNAEKETVVSSCPIYDKHIQ